MQTLKQICLWRLPLTLILGSILLVAVVNGSWTPPFGITYREDSLFYGKWYWTYLDDYSAAHRAPILTGWYWVNSDEAGIHRWRLTAGGSATLHVNNELVYQGQPPPGEILQEVVEVDLQAGSNLFSYRVDNQMPEDFWRLIAAIEEPRPFIGGWRYLPYARLYPNEPGTDPGLKTTPPQDQQRVRLNQIALLVIWGAGLWLLASTLWQMQQRIISISRRHGAFFVACFFLALIPRLILVYDRAARDIEFYVLPPGTDNYIQLGRSVLVGAYSIPGSLWGPGNIIWMTEWQRWFGPGLMNIHLANAVLGAAASLLMVDITRRLWGWRAAKGTALLVAFFPPLILYQTSAFVEGMGTTLTMVILWCLAVYIQTSPDAITLPSLRLTYQGWMMLALGVSLGIGGLFRPTLLVFGIALPLSLWLMKVGWKRILWRSIPVAVICILTIAPMTLANYLVGAKVLISVNGPQNLHIGNNETSDGIGQVISVSYHSAEVRGYDHMQGVLDSIADSPKRAFELILRKIGLVWSAKEDGQLISIDRNGKEVSPFFAMLYQDGWFGFYAIAFIGLIGIFVADYRTGYRTQWMIPVSVMLFTLATAAIEALSRLRIQLVLPLMVSGGYALAYVSGMLKVHPFVFTNWRRLLFAVGGTILLMSTLYLFETTLPRPRYFSGSQLPAEVIPQDATFDGAIHLIGYQPIAHNIHQDGGVIAGRLYFERVGAVKHDYTVSVIAILPDGKVTQGEDWRLGHTGYPRLDADEWTLGKGLRDEFFIELPSFTSLPAVIKLGVILYSEEAGRAEATGNAVILGGNTVLLRQIGIIVEQVKRQPLPQNTPLPNKVTLPVRFGDSIELTDYALDKLSVQHGESVTISIDWQAVRPVSGDYNVYIHLYDDSSATIYGQGDGIPTHLGIELPTSFWSVGVPIYDRYTLRVNPDTPPGTYPIKLGFYNLLDGVRLPVDSTGGDGLVIAELEVR